MFKRLLTFAKTLRYQERKLKDTSISNQIISAARQTILTSREQLELKVTKDVEIASYSITVNQINGMLFEIEINPLGIYHSYLYLYQNLGLRLSLEEYTEIVVAHEIGHSVCTHLKEYIQYNIRTKEDRDREPMTLILHEIYAWKHSLRFISKNLPKEAFQEIACLSLKTYTAELLGERYIESTERLLKSMVK